jgi:hypothetical protein
MSGIGSVTSSAIDLLAAIRQQIQAASGTSDALGALAGDSTTSASIAQSSAGTAVQTTGSGTSSFDPIVLNVIIQFQEQQSAGTGADTSGSAAVDPATRGQQIFQKLDADGDGTITQPELESALGAKGVDTSQADAIFQKLDANDDGSVSQGEFAAAAPHGHGHHPPPPSGADGAGALGASSSSGTASTGETTQSVTNPDGSTTTTITYSDGATVTLTTPASTSGDTSTASGSTTGSSKDTFSANMEKLLETLVQLQAAFQPNGQTGQATSMLA